MIQFLYRDPAPSRTHCTPCRALARPYRGPTMPCRGPCLGHIAGRLGCVMAESWPIHVSAVYCDSNLKKKLGSTPFHVFLHTFFFHLPLFFFFTSFCFFIPPPKKKYIFSFSNKPNKFIKIYFIYFFPVLYIVKPQKKFSSIHNFFFHFILDYLPKISQPPKVLIPPMLFIKHTST